jgi:PAS domain S-box-containing protein
MSRVYCKQEDVVLTASTPVVQPNWITTLRSLLIDPLDAELSIDELRTARLLCVLTLLFIVVEIGVGSIYAALRPEVFGWGTALGHVRTLSTFALVLIYGMSRLRPYKVVTWLLLANITFTIFSVFLSFAEPGQIFLLTYIAIPIAVSFLFLSIRHTIIFACLCLISVALIPLVAPRILFSQVLLESVGFLATMGATLIFINIYIRQIGEARTRTIQESEARYRMLIEQAADGILISGPDTAILDVNQAFCAMLGYPKEALYKMRLRALALPQDLEEVPLHVKELAEGKVVIQVRRLIRQDGTILYAEISGKQLPDGNFQSIVRDLTESRRLEQAKQEREEFFRAIVENSSDTVFLTDANGVVLYVGPSMERLFGHTIAELMQHSRYQFVHPDDTDRLKDAVTQVEQTHGRSITIQYRRRHKNGAWLWVESVLTNMLDVPGVGAIVVNLRDITDRRNAEYARLNSEERYRAIFEQAASGIVEIRLDGRVLRANPKLLEILGYEAAELHNLPVQALLDPALWSAVRRDFKQLLTGKLASYARDIQLRHRDGSTVWVNVVLSTIHVLPGTPEYFVGLVEDITQRKRTEAELERNRRELEHSRDASHHQNRIFESMLASISDGVVVANERGEYSVVNKPAHDLLGVGPVDGRPQTLTDSYKIFRPDRKTPYPSEELPLARAIRGESCEQEILVIAHPVRGEFVTLSVSGNPIRDEAGGSYGGVIVFRDITEQQKSQQAIIDLNATLEDRVQERTMELRAAVKELEGFSYTVSHDLRAPLRAIDGYSRILMRDFQADLPPVAQQRVTAIRAAAQRMSTLIDDLLEFSRLNRQAMRHATVDMQALVNTVLTELEPEREGRTFEISVGALPPAVGDAAMLKQVFQNLIANAIKFTRPRAVAQIQISSIVDGDHDVYVVRDNGAGFDMAYADKLFGVFQRLHSEKEFEGTGVGLAIVQNVIQRHKGRVWVESAVDQGTTFYFYLGKIMEPPTEPNQGKVY